MLVTVKLRKSEGRRTFLTMRRAGRFLVAVTIAAAVAPMSNPSGYQAFALEYALE
jgi:hypothetical protein